MPRLTTEERAERQRVLRAYVQEYPGRTSQEITEGTGNKWSVRSVAIVLTQDCYVKRKEEGRGMTYWPIIEQRKP